MFQPMVMEIYLFFVTVLISDLYFLIVLIRKTYWLSEKIEVEKWKLREKLFNKFIRMVNIIIFYYTSLMCYII